MLRPYRFERELDRSIAQWLAWLPRWEPGTLRRRNDVCTICPRYADELGLDDLPHGPLHALVTSVESLLIEHFLRNAAAKFPELERDGEWKVWLDRGIVRITASDGREVDELLGDGEPTTPLDALLHGSVTPAQAAEARVELVRLYYGLFHAAVNRLGSQRTVVLRAVDAYIEPKIQRMAEELVSEVCGA
jgi:hypothetical protein